MGLRWDFKGDPHPVIVNVAPATPAADAGIEVGSEIIKIDDLDTRLMGDLDCRKHMSGPAGSTVVLLVRSPIGEERRVVLKRKELEKVDSRLARLHYRTSDRVRRPLNLKGSFEVPYLLKAPSANFIVVLEFEDGHEGSSKDVTQWVEIQRERLRPVIHSVVSAGEKELHRYFHVKEGERCFVFIGDPSQLLIEKVDVVREPLDKELFLRTFAAASNRNLERRLATFLGSNTPKKEQEALLRSISKSVAGCVLLNGKTSSQKPRTDLDYAPFMEGLRKKIKGNWKPPRADRSRTTVVMFQVDAQGQVRKLRVTQSSGLVPLDDSATKAITLSSPFDRTPHKKSLDIQFTFTYNVHEMAIQKETKFEPLIDQNSISEQSVEFQKFQEYSKHLRVDSLKPSSSYLSDLEPLMEEYSAKHQSFRAAVDYLLDTTEDTNEGDTPLKLIYDRFPGEHWYQIFRQIAYSDYVMRQSPFWSETSGHLSLERKLGFKFNKARLGATLTQSPKDRIDRFLLVENLLEYRSFKSYVSTLIDWYPLSDEERLLTKDLEDAYNSLSSRVINFLTVDDQFRGRKSKGGRTAIQEQELASDIDKLVALVNSNLNRERLHAGPQQLRYATPKPRYLRELFEIKR